jgi:hypothetical protein
MISTSGDIPLVAISVNVYRFLLAAYPAKFRQEYGEDMLQLFRDCALRAVGQSGSNGMVRLWAVTFLDLIQSLFKEHLQKETNMSKSTFIRISGWALVLAGIVFLMAFTGWYLDENYPLIHIEDSIYMAFSYTAFVYAGPVFLSLGLLGLRARYGETLGNTASTVLLLTAVLGPLSTLVAIVSDSLWIFIIVGPVVQMIGLTIFGIIAVQKKPLPRGNGLSILSAILPIAFGTAAFEANLDTGLTTFLFALLVLQFLATMAVGSILQGDAPQEETTMTAA